MKAVFIGVVVAAFVSGCAATGGGRSGLEAIIPAGAQVELVQEGFQFTEGPLDAADGGLYFTDLGKPSRIRRMDPGGKIDIYVDNTARANGLAYLRNGDMVTVEAEAKRVTRVNRNRTLTEVSADSAASSGTRVTMPTT